MTRDTKCAFLFLISIFFCIPRVQGQDGKHLHSDETVAQIPILTDFHDVIYQIWHTAWPEKNTAMLVELLPQVRQFSDSIARVPIPGILRDKEKQWKEGTEKLQEIVAEYGKSSAPVDTQKLLGAAEQLHAQFEKLVRVTRPVLKEMDEFHQVLYMLYHHYLPDTDQEKVVSSVKQLKERMAALDKASLPERLKKKETAFNESRATLSRSVSALDPSLVKEKMEDFAASVEKTHSDYQALEKVFE